MCAGFRPTLPLCLTPALTLLLFQLLSRLRLPHNSNAPSRQSALGAFLSGASANALATTILYPLILAKVRVQAARSQAANGGTKQAAASVTDVWTAAVKRDGWTGLYQALGAQILKGFVSQGVTMLVKQRYVHHLGSHNPPLLRVSLQHRARYSSALPEKVNVQSAERLLVGYLLFG